MNNINPSQRWGLWAVCASLRTSVSLAVDEGLGGWGGGWGGKGGGGGYGGPKAQQGRPCESTLRCRGWSNNNDERFTPQAVKLSSLFLPFPMLPWFYYDERVTDAGTLFSTSTHRHLWFPLLPTRYLCCVFQTQGRLLPLAHNGSRGKGHRGFT